MGKLDCCLANKVYTIRKQYPVIREFGKRIREVEKELNKDHSKKKSTCNPCGKSMCDGCGKPMCKNVCKNRQKP